MKMGRNVSQSSVNAKTSVNTKKKYHSPQFIELGHVASLTLGAFSTMHDGDGTKTFTSK